MEHSKIKAVFSCPSCKKDNYGDFEAFRKTDCATMDCAECGDLLYLRDSKIYRFHEYMHSQNERWPENGEGTGCIKIKE